MVAVHIFTRRAAVREYSQGILMRLLSRAAYATANLVAVAGRDYEEELSTISRIKAGMVGNEPRDPSAINKQDTAEALNEWENEGGALQRATPSENDLQPKGGRVYLQRYASRKDHSGTWSVVDSYDEAICEIGGRQVSRLRESDAAEMADILNEHPNEAISR
ncbi:hypothetical protein J5N58_05780 [Rhizobium cremeum]|uniref:hypothetical protein n=1 Tax=Rhizobium cremeum TaxID=2813827 RepID=UPI001FD45633|nr:hypothetical protein [Rhizobium cremeum]MCJ7994127.1 hypothetical protein [Rhizobium cremeum]MCJ7999184.1 hypothetical protein [Rhizobium cremeum]